MKPLETAVLPPGIRSRFVDDINSLRVHILEAGFDTRAYFHHKSADWKENRPHRLASWSAAELAKMPTYYIMDLAEDMPATVAKQMPSASQVAACKWPPDLELAVYAAEYQRNGFQGGLNWYRSRASGAFDNELQAFAERTIDVPSIFIAGKSDWSIYQQPGVLERMQETGCTRMAGCHLLEGRDIGFSWNSLKHQFIANRVPPRACCRVTRRLLLTYEFESST
jgi:hypothetical protein